MEGLIAIEYVEVLDTESFELIMTEV